MTTAGAMYPLICQIFLTNSGNVCCGVTPMYGMPHPPVEELRNGFGFATSSVEERLVGRPECRSQFKYPSLGTVTNAA